eukprot:gene19669-26355_t
MDPITTITSFGQAHFEEVDVSGVTNIAGPLTLGSAMSKFTGSQDLTVLGSATFNHNVVVEGNLDVKGKIVASAQEENLSLDSLNVTGDAVFNGQVSAAGDLVFKVADGKRFVFKVADAVVATIDKDGMKVFNEAMASLGDIDSLLLAIASKGLDQEHVLQHKVGELVVAVNELKTNKIKPLVVEVASMLMNLRSKTKLAFDLEKKIGDMLDGVPQKARHAASSLETTLLESLQQIVKMGSDKAIALQASVAKDVAMLKDLAASDLSFVKAKVDRVMNDVKLKPSTAGVQYKSEKEQLMSHVDAIHALLLSRIASLSADVSIKVGAYIGDMVATMDALHVNVASKFD